MTRFWDGRTDGRTDRRSACTPRPAFAFGDAGKKYFVHILDAMFQPSPSNLSFNKTCLKFKYLCSICC